MQQETDVKCLHEGQPGRNSRMGVPAYALGGGSPLARHQEARLSQRGDIPLRTKDNVQCTSLGPLRAS